MSKMLSLIAGISALALAGTAYSGEPLKLTDKQMGVVTAGAPHGSLTLFTGVSLALLWVAATTTRLVRQATP